MEPSPLTQQARPETFQPKVVQLYTSLFNESDDIDKSEGFWREFFLLRPDGPNLQRVLVDLSADGLLHLQSQSQQLFWRAVQHVKAGNAPSDEIALDVSCPWIPFTARGLTSQTLTAFLGGVLQKKYTNPSSDIIAVLAGLDQVDATFTEFVSSLDNLIRGGRNLDVRQKAVEVALAVTSGAYQTGLVSYFTHRDLFPSLMKFIQDSDKTDQAFKSFLLLGLLANYNKFEFQNPYRLRFDDFVNEATIQKILRSFGNACSSARDRYVAVQEDLPEGWTFNTTLTFFGLGVLTPSAKAATQASDPEAAKALFAALPGREAAVLLATYDFTVANKLFCFNFVSLPAEHKHEDSPFSGFLSFTSYLIQHAHRSTRASVYTTINLFVLRILVEDPVLCKQICSDESKTTVRLCRQRQPYLPLVRGDRVHATVLLDMMVDGINHNLRRRLDVDLYILCIGVILRLVSFLSRSRVRLAYHWSELWRTFLSLIRFLTTYANDLKSLRDMSGLLDTLVNLIALSLSAGEAFLPSPAEYDDLFYKLVEIGDTLVKFRDAYDLDSRPTNSIATLISVSEHYNALLESSASKARSKNLSPKDVGKVIKQGYETLSIQAKEGLDGWANFREADERVVLKKVTRVVVADVQALLVEQQS
ncbi:MAG: hypothetical protein M1827_005060 [Pycnora praestabilis]|nr:MAG: hypothetical protein M1827_005060 [Pycnora praestabilis]